MTNKHPENIEAILNSLDGVQRAEPKPFFFTRLQARIAYSKSFWEKISYLITRPVIAFSVIVGIVMINSAFLLSNTTATLQGEEELNTEEYDFAVATIYEYENTDPNEQ